MVIILKDLPKISLNEWYSGVHWSKRKKIKDNYKLIVKSQFKNVLSRHNEYIVDYMFYFAKNPLDATNCVAMVKLIEDIIFESDKYDIVLKFSVSSEKSVTGYDYIKILINE